MCISIADTGTGIPEEQMDELFSPYVSTKPDGTGIGLSISHRIVAAHGGKIDAANNSDGGATFAFTLPFSTDQDAGQPVVASL